ncbi:MAG: apolipoprotein N-acyltransferase [Candidatus Hydrogenedentota bacterium]
MIAALFRAYAPAVSTGVLLALAFPRVSLFWLAWVALVPLLASTWQAGVKAASGRFCLAGLVFHLIVLHWLVTNVYWAGGAALTGYVLLSLVMALYWAAAGAAWSWLQARLPVGVTVFAAFPALWVVMEKVQATLFTGFGWSALAHSQGPNLAVLQWAAVGGGALIAFGIAAANAGLAAAWAAREGKSKAWLAGGCAGLIVAAHGVGYTWLDEPRYGEEPYKAAVVQPNFSQQMKWDPQFHRAMVEITADASRALAADTSPDIFVWPEALIMPPFIRQIEDEELRISFEPGIGRLLQEFANDTGAPLFTGAQRRDPATGNAYNSSHLLDAEGFPKAIYDKVHLTPFGEYVPLGDYLPFVGQFVPAIGELHSGAELKVMEAGERTFGPLICFEVLFAPMAETLRNDGADFLVVITNLGWFGASAAPEQELDIARVRAVETRLPLVHVGNTGITGVFDPYGRFEVAQQYFRTGPVETGQGLPRIEEAVRFEAPALGATLGRRTGDVLPVAEPAERVLDYGPPFFPYVAGLLLLLTAVWALLRGSRPSPGPGKLSQGGAWRSLGG